MRFCAFKHTLSFKLLIIFSWRFVGHFEAPNFLLFISKWWKFKNKRTFLCNPTKDDTPKIENQKNMEKKSNKSFSQDLLWWSDLVTIRQCFCAFTVTEIINYLQAWITRITWTTSTIEKFSKAKVKSCETPKEQSWNVSGFFKVYAANLWP